MELNCKKCTHFYAKMVGPEGLGYNPGPCCRLYEDTGEHPKILTQECYKPRKAVKRQKGN